MVSAPAKPGKSRFFYGWFIVAASLLIMAANSTVLNSFSLFFKPLAAHFGWNRTTTSGIQSLYLIIMGVFCIIMGRLADRFGRARVLAACAVLTSTGLILTSHATSLWHFYITYSLMVGVGCSCNFSITGTTTAAWFTKNRGLALGIVASGAGLASFIGVPGVERMISAFGWSGAYMGLGVAVGSLMLLGAWVLRRPPEPNGRFEDTAFRPAVTDGAVNFWAAIRTSTLWIMTTIFFLLAISNQIVMVHLVNYATDQGTAVLVAATLISGIGLSGIAGRVLMGSASDRIGSITAVIVACLGVATSLVWLAFARQLWMLYIFTILYGFSFGAELPQQTALIGRFYGLQAGLVGLVHGLGYVGGSIGALVGGLVYDMTQSYVAAFLFGAGAVTLALVCTLVLGRSPLLARHPRPIRAGR